MFDLLIQAFRTTLNEISVQKSRLFDLNHQINLEQDNVVRLKKEIAEWKEKYEVEDAKYWTENSKQGCSDVSDESDTTQELKDMCDDVRILDWEVDEAIDALWDRINISEKVCNDNLKEGATVGEKISAGNITLESQVSQITENLNAANVDLIQISDSQFLEISNLLKDYFV